MIKRVIAAALAAVMVTFGITTPAHADPVYDFAVTGSAVVSQANVPTIITWTITVTSIGDDMGIGAAQEGEIQFTAPSTISLVLSDDCDTTGNAVTCYWFAEDGVDDNFEVNGFVGLLALGAITITPAITVYPSRTDAVSSNNSVNITCNAITSLLVIC